ncbi:hypothetical protein O0L34_g11323 [Tuta absoluta]|nr:hypothetical protein O0L34_g11323 [Tuta absoluta]
MLTASLADVTYYETLGVSKQASTQEIRQAYKKLAIKYHPDKNPEASVQEMFLKITEAYETLKDPDKRHNYDVFGSYPSYTKTYDHRSQAEYNNLYYNGLYHDDPYVETLSSGSFYNFLQEGFHFINFYSPFCPPCQNLVDHWKKLAEVYKGIVKVGAVNCKYYNNFCYNSMRIGSYPTLLFYPNGRKGNYIVYQGERTIEALDQFMMSYLRNQMHVPVVTQIRSTDKPMAYVLGRNRIEKDSLTRIAYHLKGLVTVAIVEDDNLRSKLTTDEYTSVVFRFRKDSKDIESTDEKEVLKEIVAALPKVDLIDPEKFKKIRNQLRSGHKTPWAIYFSSKENDGKRLELHQMTVAHTDMHFGEIDCDEWMELCASLQIDAAHPGAGTPGWGVLKPGGAYQRVWGASDVALAARATHLHSLSHSHLQRILAGERHTCTRCPTRTCSGYSPEVSLSLSHPGAGTPGWGVLKPGGAYQRVWGASDVALAARATHLHSLSHSHLQRILAGGQSVSLAPASDSMAGLGRLEAGGRLPARVGRLRRRPRRQSDTPALAVPLAPAADTRRSACGAPPTSPSPPERHTCTRCPTRTCSGYSPEVSLSLSHPGAGTPGWSVLKPGGAYQRVWGASDVALAARATHLHSLSHSHLQRILAGERHTCTRCPTRTCSGYSPEVSLSLSHPGAGTPGWGVLKPGGAYQRVWGASDVALAARATHLHSLSHSHLQRILVGDTDTWVLSIVPYKLSWGHIEQPFTKASLHFIGQQDISFGIMVCSLQTEKVCRSLASDQPAIIVQRGRQRDYYQGAVSEAGIVEFIDLLRDSTGNCL